MKKYVNKQTFASYYFIIFAGLPATIESSGICFKATTEPVPIIERAPIDTPLRIVELAPINTSSPIITGADLHPLLSETGFLLSSKFNEW